MRFRKPTHPVTADHRREIDIRVLSKARAFNRPMRFPFQHLEVTAPDHIRVFRVGDKKPLGRRAGSEMLILSGYFSRQPALIRSTPESGHRNRPAFDAATPAA